MPDQLVLDTDIVIHLLKKHPAIVDQLVRLREQGTIFLLSPVVMEPS